MQAIEIAIRYDTLLRLSVSHNFFGEDTPDMFSWYPAPDTQHLLNQMGILMRHNANDIVLLASSSEKESIQKKYQEVSSFTFSFALYSENQYFNHFTNIPLETKGKVFYFTNTQSKKDLLHQNQYASSSDLLDWAQGKYVLNGQKNKTSFILKHHCLPTEETFEANEKGDAEIHTQHLPVGKYDVLSKQKNESTFINYPHTNTNKRFLAWIDVEIEASKIEEWIKAFNIEEKIIPQNYKIQFETRNTYWRYYFIPKYIQNLENSEIETDDPNIEFGSPKQVTLPNGMGATCFEAKKPNPLHKQAGKFMRLIRKKDGKGNQVRQVLCKVPYPNFEGLRAESRNLDAKIYSEVLIYV